MPTLYYVVESVKIVAVGFGILSCLGEEPFKPRDGSLPFLVYFSSRYRGLCVGSLVSRTAVLTAAVCVVDPLLPAHDARPVNVVTGATYRHPRRGIRVQVTKIIIPKLSNTTGERAYMIQKSPAVLLLARKVPDLLAEIPLRPVEVDYRGEEALSLHEECLMAGWHFFYKGDKIYPVHKFLLQRNVRVQFLIIVKKSLWCDTISLKFQNAMTNLGYTGDFDRSVSICVRDPNREAQPCHGMYGAPLVCKGKLVALLMAPDAQWTNCTGHSNLVQVLSSPHVRSFMNCVSRLVDMSQCMYGVLRALCARASWSHC
ncbi:uncharacterized protein LOC112047643 isoform X2 [Bicyclus anynana]|uniref:Uncharacterized protein LOC112047643 isoform X2 n=1 Tax=Bicyclus anynana TaxID=110368 RepID=A0A6J1MYE1_BICAN|nr:uncharacterized protein LOC112047643 isoform X2 [Bicyclus anynana]